MKDFITELRGAVLGTLIFAVACCGIYPLVVYGIAQTAFHNKANGSLIIDRNGTIRGSQLIGQNFAGEKYFHSRPSAAGNGYDAVNSGGSNLGPTSQKLNDTIRERIATYRTENGLKDSDPVPADAVTASASGLDPHISIRNAEMQAPRIAKARNMTAEAVLNSVKTCTDAAGFGVLGDPGVNVLKLNLLLDEHENENSNKTIKH